MKLSKNNLGKSIAFAILPLAFIGCGNGTCSTNADHNSVSLGTLPTGQSVTLSSADLVVDVNTSGTAVGSLSVPGLADNQTVTFEMSNPQDNPSLLFAPKDNSDQKIKQSGYNYSTCTVTAKSPNCTITSRVVGANNGKYLADLSYLMTNPESTGLLKPIPYTITGGSPTPNPSPTPTPQPPKKSYAYISNSKGNSYTQCIVDADGIIDKSSCSTITPTGAGQLNAPTGIAFNENYAYILNNSDNSYTQCNVGVSGIESASCTTITPKDDAENPILNRPTGIIFSGSYAYITSNRRDSYTQCNVVASGIESASCNTITPTGLGALDGPFRMAISGNYAYFVNNKNNSYTQCNVGASGIESASCIVNQ